MSRWPGRLITKTPIAPSGASAFDSAPGVWTLPEVAYWTKQGLWPNAANVGDPYFKYVSYLLGTTSTNAAQNNTFLDSSTNNFTITRNGNATQGAFSPYAARWSNYFDGSGDYLASSGGATSAMGAGDFSCEAFVYWTSYPTQYTSIFSTRSTNNANAAAFTVGVESSGYVYAFSSAFIAQTASGVFALNTWNHVVFTRSGTTARLFVNGVLRATGTNSQNFSDQGFAVAANRDGTEPGAGYISNVRLVKGAIPPEYQTSSTSVGATIFTPPTSPLTAISGTSLLTCQSNRFRDASANNFAITANGNTAAIAFNPFGQPAPGYSAATYGGSAYLDGSGDYLTAASNDAYRMDQGDWTLEAWIYPKTTGSAMAVSSRGVYLSTYGFFFGMISAGALYYEAGNGGWGTSGAYSSPTGVVIANQWNHVAAVRSGTSFYMYANGVRVLSQASAAFGANVTAPLYIGSYVDGSQNILNGNMADYRFIKGTALYTGATYSVPTAPLTAVTNTSLLLNYTNVGIYDASMNSDMETVGTAQVSTGQAKFGMTSAYIPNATSLLKGPLTQNTAFGTGDFTVEAWIYSVATTSGYTCIFTSRDGVTSQANTVFFGLKPNTNQLTFYTSSEIIGTSTAVSTGVWTHVALVRNSGATAIYINGTSAGTATFTTALTGTGLAIGNEYSLASSNGGLYVDDLRITKGYARYTTNFTPPSSAFFAF